MVVYEKRLYTKINVKNKNKYLFDTAKNAGVINYGLGIPCKFHNFRDTHVTRLIEQGADIKAVSKRLGHSYKE